MIEDYMYMHTKDGSHYFKNIDTRQYLTTTEKESQSWTQPKLSTLFTKTLKPGKYTQAENGTTVGGFTQNMAIWYLSDRLAGLTP